MLKRDWKAGDKVEVALPMPVKTVRADVRVAAKRGLVAFERGPIVYCAESDGEVAVSEDVFFSEETVVAAGKTYPALGNFPHEGVMTPLMFRLVKNTGLDLSAVKVPEDRLVIVGEGGKKCFGYLSVDGRVIECNGLDLESDFPEGACLLESLVDYLIR